MAPAATVLLAFGSKKQFVQAQAGGFEADVLSKLEKIETMIAQPPPVARTPVHYGDRDIEAVVFTPEQIEDAVKRVGAEISRDYAGKEVIVVGLLSGVFIYSQ